MLYVMAAEGTSPQGRSLRRQGNVVHHTPKPDVIPSEVGVHAKTPSDAAVSNGGVVAMSEHANRSAWCLVTRAKAAAQRAEAKVLKAIPPGKDKRHGWKAPAPKSTDFFKGKESHFGHKMQAAQAMPCGSSKHWLSKEEVQYAMCPPGNYLSHTTAQTHARKQRRLRQAMCKIKTRGADPIVNRQEGSAFRSRGYSTYESSAWPKFHGCRHIVDEKWYAETDMHNRMPPFKPDMAPPHMGKLVSSWHFGHVEFHKAWKVASTAFPDYLRCEYEGSWDEVPSSTPVPEGGKVAFAVREPIGRWISAVGELLERSINHYCPSGPCGAQDAFDLVKTPKILNHMTSWFRLVKGGKGYHKPQLPELVRRMVRDTSCNYMFYAGEHFSSQSTYAAQNGPHRAANLSLVMKLENLNADLAKLSQVIRGTPTTKCEFVPQNSKVCKPGQGNLPDAADIMKILAEDHELMRTLCLVYAQDFVCFDYDLPPACHGLF